MTKAINKLLLKKKKTKNVTEITKNSTKVNMKA